MTRAHRSPWIVAGIALLALLACLLLGLGHPQQALLSYLTAYMFCLAPALGSMALLMVHALTGGAWGFWLRPYLLSAMRVLPLLAVLLLPLLFGLHALYPWAHAATLEGAPHLAQQRWYLDDGFFIVRAAICFVAWLWLAHGMRRRLLDAQRAATLPRFAAFGLIVYALSVSMAAVDWVMSLVPGWHSSIFGMIVATGQILAAAALAVLCACLDHVPPPPASAPAEPGRLLHDGGNLLLTLVLAWWYLAFMDYLTAWISDLPADTVWYIPRTLTSWQWLGAFLLVFHALVPFAVLLSRAAKHRVGWLAGVAGTLLAAHLGYAFWLVVPNFRAHGFDVRLTDPLAAIGVAGLCWVAFVHGLQLQRLDPALPMEAAA
ncbi:MAG TPA: hypothetical protein VFJ04_08000 [Rhodanobacteraceae bacterium]|nr:hypothetical protein [Rhodanobacteraceae bacterium]